MTDCLRHSKAKLAALFNLQVRNMNYSKLSSVIALWLVVRTSTVMGQHASQPSTDQLVLPDSSYTIPFEWYGDSIGSVYEPYAALLLPVRIAGCSKGLYMQFDLGAGNSMFYRKELVKISEQCGPAFDIPDSIQTLRLFPFQIGRMNVTAKAIQVLDFEDEQPYRSPRAGMHIIGTIGADFIQDRIIMIDYPRKQIINASQMPEGLTVQAQMSDFTWMGGKVLLPAMIDGAETMLYFDTGSSAFELLTDKQNFERMALVGAFPVQYPVSSWGRVLTAHTVQTGDSLRIAWQWIPIGHVTYMEGVNARQEDRMKKIGVGGMTGNKLFLRKRLLFDVRRRKFAVLEP